MGKRKFKTWKAEKAYAEVLMGEHPWDQGGEVHLAIADATAVIQPEPAPAPPPSPAPAVKKSTKVIRD